MYTGSCFSLLLSNKVEAQGQQNESQGEPLGGLCQLGVQRLGLALGQEGLCAAGDGAGEAGALAALHKHDRGDSNAGEDLENSENNGDDRHLFQPFQSLQI